MTRSVHVALAALLVCAAWCSWAADDDGDENRAGAAGTSAAGASVAGAPSAELTGATAGTPVAATTPDVPPAFTSYDLDVAVQGRSFFESGVDGQDRFQPSVSLAFQYQRLWDDDRRNIVFTPFARYDAMDDERTHADIRELFYGHVGDTVEVLAGVRRVFWGVTEFQHLVDIVNQTDLVENIDGEDKLGQPMVQWSFVRDWGTVDVFALTGFRERTFAGPDGRLNAVPVDDDPFYESSAEQLRTDFAIRYSAFAGPVEFGVYQFSGTSREPVLVPELQPGGVVFRPYYPVIDQTGLDAQAITGDWAWKLEAMSRSGYGDRYWAATGGFERTMVGVFGTRSDLGLVLEYMHDKRDDEAFNTIFEHDVALGLRWSANDIDGTQALVGWIFDVESSEYVFTLEASRRLGRSWGLYLESRVFGSGDDDAGAFSKTAALQQDDYIQIELTKYF